MAASPASRCTCAPPFTRGSDRFRTKSTLNRNSSSRSWVRARSSPAAASTRNSASTNRLTCGAIRTIRSDTSTGDRGASGAVR